MMAVFDVEEIHNDVVENGELVNTWSIPKFPLQSNSLVHSKKIPNLLEYDQFVM